jgi:oxygen-dependent protoporphyrinogen oxidase
VNVAVVGGGITGLSLAYYLTTGRRRSAEAPEQVAPIYCTLLEAEPRVGGKIETTHEDGFRIEGGPDSFVSRKPHALDLARELDLEDRLLPAARGKNVYILRNGALVPLPPGMRLIVPTEPGPFLRSPLLSPAGRLRALAERFVPPRRCDAGGVSHMQSDDASHVGSDESIASFARRRFGGEMLSRVAEPLMAGIHLGDPERLSMGSAFPHYVRMEQEHGSLIRAMRPGAGPAAAARGGRGARSAGASGGISFTSFVGGMGELVTTLERAVRERATVRTNARVSSMTATPGTATRGGAQPGSGRGGWPRYTLELAGGETVEADVVVLTVPAAEAARLLEPTDQRRAALLGDLRAVSSATVSMAFRDGRGLPELDGTGFVVPRREGRVLRGCSWSSSKFAHRAPEGAKLLRVFVGGDGEEEIVERSDSELTELALRELGGIIDLKAAPDRRAVFRYWKGTPQYQVGHAARMADLDAMPRNGVFLAGTSYRGVGIPDCVKDALETAETLIAYNTGEKS